MKLRNGGSFERRVGQAERDEGLWKERSEELVLPPPPRPSSRCLSPEELRELLEKARVELEGIRKDLSAEPETKK